MSVCYRMPISLPGASPVRTELGHAINSVHMVVIAMVSLASGDLSPVRWLPRHRHLINSVLRSARGGPNFIDEPGSD